MTRHLFELPEAFSIPLEGEEARFPVRRIFCVGRNYAAHAAEMGNEVDREAPFYFIFFFQAEDGIRDTNS